MFIKRNLKDSLINYATKFPVVAVIGPRQAGKTTLTKKTFPNHTYFSLENPDTLDIIRLDPRDFLEKDYGSAGIILDEFQNEPQLLSYIQGIVDNNRRPGYFILTGSHNFLMNQAISQSLAGRVALLTLLPLSLQELKQSNQLTQNIDEAVFQGGYPDIFARHLHPTEFYPQYTKTYVERDIRQLINVGSLTDFQRFMRLCAGRIGQLLNISSLADDCNVSVPTIKSWLSILEASYIVFLLQPHFNNYSKRLIKSPKLYFYDTGLACWLLKITSTEQLNSHYLRGGLVESMIISEFYKGFYNQAQEPSVYFWRDSHGREIDCLLDYGTDLIPIEIKSGKTIQKSFFDGLHYWCELANIDPSQGYVIYAGTESHKRSVGSTISWQDAGTIIR
ncbi:MAG: ATP-binding protein [Candidatus Dependentiae bacterium]|nr:ATP-binding protein [Candidatus Dependentiae bacterium]